MGLFPGRLSRQSGRHALVDTIPFTLPVSSHASPALLAGFSIDGDAAAALLPGNEVHPLRLPGGRAVLLVTVIDYRVTSIGRYIEFSVAIACTHGAPPRPPPRGGRPRPVKIKGPRPHRCWRHCRSR